MQTVLGGEAPGTRGEQPRPQIKVLKCRLSEEGCVCM